MRVDVNVRGRFRLNLLLVLDPILVKSMLLIHAYSSLGLYRARPSHKGNRWRINPNIIVMERIHILNTTHSSPHNPALQTTFCYVIIPMFISPTNLLVPLRTKYDPRCCLEVIAAALARSFNV
jgi:hypothetical protein